MSLRRLPRRLLALLLGGLAAGAVAVACSIPTREDGGSRASACSEGCPETDGSTDGPTEAAQIGFDGGTDQPPRNANCGAPAECNPDPGEAAWSCQGTLVQQPSSSPGSFPTPSGPLDADLAGTKPPVEATRPVLACQILVVVPKENLLDRFTSVNEEGKFESPIASDNRRFFTMLGTLVGGPNWNSPFGKLSV